jgi:hypothetical protein
MPRQAGSCLSSQTLDITISMIAMHLRASIIAISVLLASCATNVPSSYKPDAATGKGLIVGTITHTSFGGEHYILVYNKTEYGETTKISVGSSQWHPFTKINDSDLKARGDTFAIEAKPGEYEMGSWVIRQGSFRYWGEKAMGVTFNVEAGKVTYIGNIHMVDKEYVNLQDMAARDLPVLEARFPALKTAPMAFKIAEGTKLERLGGKGDWRMRPPVIIPIPAPR